MPGTDGSNPSPSTGESGGDDFGDGRQRGNPLLMELDLDFMPSGDIFLQFQQDSSLGAQTFFDPLNGAPITGSIDDFVATRLISALVFDPTTTTWTLSGDVSLLGDRFDVPTAVSTLNIDYILTQQVSGVPEPPTLPLLAVPIILLAGLLSGRRRLGPRLRAVGDQDHGARARARRYHAAPIG